MFFSLTNKVQSFWQYLNPQTFKGDKWLWIITIALAMVSILSVYSATFHLSYRLKDGSTEYFVMRHILFWIVSVLLIFVVQKIPLKNVFNWKMTPYLINFFLILSFTLLAYTLLGTEGRNGANRWMTIGGIDIQTSDIAKLSLSVYLAYFMVSRDEQLHTTKLLFWLLIPMLIICSLVFTEDLSTAIIIASVAYLSMVVGGVATKFLFRIFAFSSVLVFSFLAYIYLFPAQLLPLKRFVTWKSRINKFVSGSTTESLATNTQAEEARNAVINGGFNGVGLGKGVHKNNLTEIHTDFIYASIIEEGGLFVGTLVIILFVALLYRAAIIYQHSLEKSRAERFAGLLAIILAIGIAFQALVHMAICVGIGPVTGIPLPMISMGGTSLILTSISIGLILSASNKAKTVNRRSKYSRSKKVQPRLVGQ